MNENTLRICAALGGIVVGGAFIGLISLALSPPEPGQINAAGILLDRSSRIYPWTIQNLMWLLFFVGLADLSVRFYRGVREQRQMGLGLLPEDDEIMLRAEDLGEIYLRVRPSQGDNSHFLQRLITRTILQFQSSRSVDQSNALLNSSLELFQHETELKYNMMRYMVWLIPTLGFIGTVIGIALALQAAGAMPNLVEQEALSEWLQGVTGSLALAFNTTLLALLLSAVLVFLLQVAEGREESVLNQAGQYCLDNLINRLYEQ